MKQTDIIKTAITVFSALLLLMATLTGESIDGNLFKWLSGLMSVVIIMWLLYEKWIWKWPLLQKISHYYFQMPVIHGTWKGILNYEINEKGEHGSVDIYVCIEQSLTSIQIRSFFEKPSESNSITARITKDFGNRLQLYYIYRSEAPHGKREENRPHDGTVVLNIIGEPVRELTGSYFTDRKGAGQIVLNKHSLKLSETLGEAKQLFK